MHSKTCVPRYRFKLGPWVMLGAAFGIPFRMRHQDTGAILEGSAAFMYRRYLMTVGIPMEVMRRIPDDGRKLGPMSEVWEPCGDESKYDPGARKPLIDPVKFAQLNEMGPI